MADFYEYGQHFPSKDVVQKRVRLSGETALVLDRESGKMEAWIDGSLIARGENHLKVQNAIHDYRDARNQHGITYAKSKFPDLGR
jgi:hypothetical protein